jgi:hypothetical protein
MILETYSTEPPRFSECFSRVPYPLNWRHTGFTPLPRHWESAGTQDGRLFFWNLATRVTTWIDPRIALSDASPPVLRCQGHTSDRSRKPLSRLPQRTLMNEDGREKDQERLPQDRSKYNASYYKQTSTTAMMSMDWRKKSSLSQLQQDGQPSDAEKQEG